MSRFTAADIALNHHEKYDGTGYPNGISVKDIPICARIVAVADVYDALTHKRVYKNAFLACEEDIRELEMNGFA
ncbi:HD domain-containing phosphohydrolase [Desulfovibrio sp. JC010]|uniref:HD-GYP domain-containing protein n=1 Tax=Desulfovibrio sp. JC010 TaxID=2593641 RepID=UPI001EF2A3B9